MLMSSRYDTSGASSHAASTRSSADCSVRANNSGPKGSLCRTPRCDMTGGVLSGARTMCRGVSSPYAHCTIGSRAGADCCTAASIAARCMLLKAFAMSTEMTTVSGSSASADASACSTVSVPPGVPTM